jgi:TolB-like protein/class 3 adenylate cyclase
MTTNTSSETRLVAILIADVVEYTRLVEMDTEATVEAWRLCRDMIIQPAIDNYGGQIVKFTGDGFLAEFRTVLQAVKCAFLMQQKLADKALDFRFGINLGDVLDDGQDIHGEGINIAARIEAMAPAGGICITGPVYEAIRNRIDHSFEDRGEHTVKHVRHPVRVWQWPSTNSEALPRMSEARAEKDTDDRPALAVLPFVNSVSDPDQIDFVDGMTEDLITDLGKVSGLFIVGRHSSFRYRDVKLDCRQVASELGVRYLLLGSLRRSGQRVRINAQLIDSTTGGELWAERIDGSLEDVFALQDDVCARVVNALSVTLTQQETRDLRILHTRNLDAWALFVRARATPYPPIPPRIAAAAEMFERVIELDNNFAGGYAGLSSMLSFQFLWGHEADTAILDRALKLAEHACAVDERFGWSQVARGLALLPAGQHSEAIESIRAGIARDPNDPDSYAYLCLALSFGGQCDEGLEMIEEALRLNPLFTIGPYHNLKGINRLLAGDPEAAVAAFATNEARQGPVGPPALILHALGLDALGRQNDRDQRVERLRGKFSGFALEGWQFPSLIKDPTLRQDLVQRMIEIGVPATSM